MANFIDLYRETNPGERRMQSAKGLQDEGFQGIIKAYQMGRGGSEASEYDTKRAEAAGKYAKRQEAMDNIKAIKETKEAADEIYTTCIANGGSEQQCALQAGSFMTDTLYPIIGDKARIPLYQPAMVDGFSKAQVVTKGEEGKEYIKLVAFHNKTGRYYQQDDKGKLQPITGDILAVPKGSGQGKKAETLEYISVLQGEPAIKLPPGETPRAGYYRKGTKLSGPEERKLRREALADRGTPEAKPQQRSLWDKILGKNTPAPTAPTQDTRTPGLF